MQRESPRALVLNPSGEISGAHAPPGIFVLDKAFVLIEGHPPTHFSYWSDLDGIRTKASAIH
jgi:hypothetical protein